MCVVSTNQQTRESILERIANDKLRVPTLRTQRCDNLDFHEVAVWELRAALEAAFEAGRSAKESQS